MASSFVLSCCLLLLWCRSFTLALLTSPPSTVTEAGQLLRRWQRDQAPSQVYTLKADTVGDER